MKQLYVLSVTRKMYLVQLDFLCNIFLKYVCHTYNFWIAIEVEHKKHSYLNMEPAKTRQNHLQPPPKPAKATQNHLQYTLGTDR